MWQYIYLQAPSPLPVFCYFLPILLCSGHFRAAAFGQLVCCPQPITRPGLAIRSTGRVPGGLGSGLAWSVKAVLKMLKWKGEREHIQRRKVQLNAVRLQVSSRARYVVGVWKRKKRASRAALNTSCQLLPTTPCFKTLIMPCGKSGCSMYMDGNNLENTDLYILLCRLQLLRATRVSWW